MPIEHLVQDDCANKPFCESKDEFIGRIQRVKPYAIVDDSLLIAKDEDSFDRINYFVLNMRQDFDYAKLGF